MAEEQVDILEMIRNTNPKGQELVDKFLKQYKTPEISGKWCRRCGLEVHGEVIHLQWHLNVSFSVWLLQMFVIEHTTNHTAIRMIDHLSLTIEELHGQS